MPFCDLFSKNHIGTPKIGSLKNIAVSLRVSPFQKVVKSFVFI